MSKRVEFLRNKFIPKIKESKFFSEAKLQTSLMLEDFKGNTAEPKASDVFNVFLAADPSPNAQYLEWMLMRFLDEGEKAQRLMVEDLSKAKEDLEFLFKHHSKLPEKQRNIKNYKSLQDLYESLSKIRKEDEHVSESQAVKAAKEGIEVWLDNDDWYVIMPLTPEAAVLYGKGTRWCTASRGGSNFEYYNRQGPLIIIINKHEEDKKKYKHQFHFESKQFMDATDGRIDEMAFLRENPDILHAIVENINDAKAFILRLQFNLPIEEHQKVINGDLDLKKIQIEELTTGLTVNGSLDMTGAQHIKRIHNLHVSGSLLLKGSSIEEITGSFSVGSIFNADNCVNLKSVPDNITIGGSCRMIGCNLSKLPSNSRVEGNMYVTNNKKLKDIPEDLFVKSHFYARNTGIKKTPVKHKIQRRIFVGDE